MLFIDEEGIPVTVTDRQRTGDDGAVDNGVSRADEMEDKMDAQMLVLPSSSRSLYFGLSTITTVQSDYTCHWT